MCSSYLLLQQEGIIMIESKWDYGLQPAAKWIDLQINKNDLRSNKKQSFDSPKILASSQMFWIKFRYS